LLLHLLKLAAQSVKLFYDFRVVSLDMLAREFRECDARGPVYETHRGKNKDSGQPAMNRSKQGRMARKTVVAKYEDPFKEATKARSVALAVTQNPLATSNRKLVADLAKKGGCRQFTLGDILSTAAA
jgi:hypothetical protein